MIVYCVSRKPSGRTRNQNITPFVAPPSYPELLIRSVNTQLMLWWWSGTTIRISTMSAAPATCHHTDTLLMTARRWLEKMLASAASTRITTNSMKTRCQGVVGRRSCR